MFSMKLLNSVLLENACLSHLFINFGILCMREKWTILHKCCTLCNQLTNNESSILNCCSGTINVCSQCAESMFIWWTHLGDEIMKIIDKIGTTSSRLTHTYRKLRWYDGTIHLYKGCIKIDNISTEK